MRFVVTVVAMLSLLAADDVNDADKPDLAALQGEWKLVSGIADGIDMPGGMIEGMKRVCKDDITTVTMNNALLLSARIKINSTTTPKMIDYEVLRGPNADKTQLGIYEITGQTIRFCFAAPGDSRPKDFNAELGSRRTCTTWKKAEKQ